MNWIVLYSTAFGLCAAMTAHCMATGNWWLSGLNAVCAFAAVGSCVNASSR